MSSSDAQKRLFRLVTTEASLALAYDTWVGSTYLSTWAGTLGVPESQLAWLTALPLLGSLGQVLGVLLFLRAARSRSLKLICLGLSSFARSLWLIPLLAAGVPTSVSEMAWAVGVLAAVSSAAGLASASFWMAWMRVLVPEKEEGRFWAGRSRWATFGVIAAHGFSSLWLAAHPGAGAFTLLLVLALISAAGSVAMLAFTPVTHPSHRADSVRAIPEFHFRELARPEFREILVFGGLMQAALYFAGPYFPYYFTKQVGLGGSSVAFWSMMTQLGIALSSAFWGKRMDAFGGRVFGRVSVLQFCSVLIALSPLPYVLGDATLLSWIGPFEYFLNGVAWAGFSVGLNTLIFQRTRGSEYMSMTLFSALLAVQGLLGSIAAWLGSLLASGAELPGTGWNGFQMLWVLAAVARLLVALFACPDSILKRASRGRAVRLQQSLPETH